MIKKYRLLVGVAISALVVWFCVFLFYQNQRLRVRIHDQASQIARQADVIDSLRRTGLVALMSSMLEKADDEVEANPNRSLSRERIAGIAALTFLLKPYARLEGDTMAKKKLSPERGQLLLMLSSMNMDPASFHAITREASFSGADLSGADLAGVDLSGADLSKANLRGANLKGANLSEANLREAQLWGAHLGKSRLMEADLTRADLSWADLNGADAIRANFHEADLVSAQLRKADLREADLQWVDFSGAFLNEADLTGADMFRATLKRAQLPKTNLTGTTLTYAILSEANLTGTDLTGAQLTNLIVADPHWLELLSTWQVIGAGDIQHQYKLVEGFSYEHSKYQLNKIEN